jgi:hypothetical protein
VEEVGAVSEYGYKIAEGLHRCTTREPDYKTFYGRKLFIVSLSENHKMQIPVVSFYTAVNSYRPQEALKSSTAINAFNNCKRP